jgi:hypothetical protein
VVVGIRYEVGYLLILTGKQQIAGSTTQYIRLIVTAFVTSDGNHDGSPPSSDGKLIYVPSIASMPGSSGHPSNELHGLRIGRAA